MRLNEMGRQPIDIEKLLKVSVCGLSLGEQSQERGSDFHLTLAETTLVQPLTKPALPEASTLVSVPPELVLEPVNSTMVSYNAATKSSSPSMSL
ncbi:hypothetical protein J6590_040405 [Homalodisca vitripennis]|nr:hypothetical protein J6590_040405 [Homalodisca vitripennis]